MIEDIHGSNDVEETIQFLAQSPNRVAILEELNAKGTGDRYALEDEVDATRRTILRTLNELEERGYVVEVDDGYRLSALGSHIYDRYRAFVDSITFDPDLAVFLGQIPEDLVSFPLDHLADSTVVLAGGGSAYAPLDRLLQLRSGAAEIRELAPGVEHRSIHQIADRIAESGDFSMEIVIPEAVFETAETNEDYADLHATIYDSDQVDFHTVPDDVELAVCIADGTVALGIESENGHAGGVCVTDDSVVVDWAHEFIDTYIAQ